MQLLALDAGFQPVAYLEYLNLQWTREYYKPGQFSVQISASAYHKGMRYIYTPDRPETGMIQSVELEETVRGRFVQLSGYFLEAILDDKIVWPTYYANGSVPRSVVAMLRQYKGDIPLLQVADTALTSDPVVWQETGGTLGEVANTRLQSLQMALRCRYNYLNNTIVVEIWQGVNRTQSQTDNPFVTFSDGFGNLAKLHISRDDSNYKNYAVVAGQDEGSNRKVAVADLSSGGYRRQLFVDAKNQRWDTDEQTEAQYLAALQQKGFDKLLDYQIVQNIELDATNSGFAYLQDWDLGDKVDAIAADIGLALEARVVTVREVWKSNNHTIHIELGDKKPTQLQKARKIY